MTDVPINKQVLYENCKTALLDLFESREDGGERLEGETQCCFRRYSALEALVLHDPDSTEEDLYHSDNDEFDVEEDGCFCTV